MSYGYNPEDLKKARDIHTGVRQVTKVRSISGSMQGFLTRLVKDFYIAVALGDKYRAKLALRFLYLSLPKDIRVNIDQEINRFARKALGVSSGMGFMDLLEIGDRDCERIMKSYGKRTSDKILECTQRVMELYLNIYGIMLTKAYDNNVFLSLTTIPIGMGEGG